MEYTGRQYFKKSVTGKTQADGSFVIDVSDSLDLGDSAKKDWTIQVVCHGDSITAGELTVGAKVPDVPNEVDHAALSDTIDLSSGSPTLYTFSATVKSLEFDPANYDGDSYDVYVSAS